jgi:hypothetical protein
VLAEAAERDDLDEASCQQSSRLSLMFFAAAELCGRACFATEPTSVERAFE